MGKSRIGKMVCLVMLMLVLSPSVMKANEVTDVFDTELNGMQPRGMICPRCGRYDFALSNTTYSAWGKQNNRLCIHRDKYAWGEDSYYVRSVIETFQCRNCSYTETFTSSEGEWVCEGYN